MWYPHKWWDGDKDIWTYGRAQKIHLVGLAWLGSEEVAFRLASLHGLVDRGASLGIIIRNWGGRGPGRGGSMAWQEPLPDSL